MDLAEAERLADRALAVEEKLHGQYARVDVIAPDGSWAQAPLRALGKLRVIDCPIQRQNWGDKGIGNTRISPTSRTTRYASTHYSCLFEAGIAPGPVLRLGVGIERSDDPELADLGGYSARIMDRTPLRALMTDLGVTLEAMPQARRAALRQARPCGRGWKARGWSSATTARRPVRPRCAPAVRARA